VPPLSSRRARVHARMTVIIMLFLSS
jgi:hypothetical protein